MSVDRVLETEDDMIVIKLADGSTVDLYGDGSWDIEIHSAVTDRYEKFHGARSLTDPLIITHAS